MPWQRQNGIYRIKRNVPGIGKVNRSLRTRKLKRARTRENMIIDLANAARLDLVEAWLDGEVSIQRLETARSKGDLHELIEELEKTDVPLIDACKRALASQAGNVGEEETIEGYRRTLKQFTRFTKNDLLDLDRDDERNELPMEWDEDAESVSAREAVTQHRINKFLGWRRHTLGRSASTVNNDRSALSVLASHCHGASWIDEEIDFSWEDTAVRIRWLSVDQIREYLGAHEGMEQVLHFVLIGSALRLGEALGLRGCDVNLEADDNWGVIGDSKTSSGVRSVYIPGWVIQRLETFLARRDPGPDDRLFPIAKRTAQKHHRDVCDDLEIDGGKPGPGADDEAANDRYRIHDHRHTAAVQLAKAGMPLNLLQRQLGHGTIGQTMRYARFHPEYADHKPYFDRMGDRIDIEQLDGWQKPSRHIA